KLRQDCAHGITPKNSSQDRKRGLRNVSLRHLVGPMPQNNVPNLMGHHAGDLGLIICSFERSPIDVNETAGQSECIDRLVVDNLELKRIFLAARGVCSQLLPDGIDVCDRLSVIEQRYLTLSLFCVASSHIDV